MKNKDTMLEDFKDFFYILGDDFLESKNIVEKVIKLIRNFFLVLVSIWVIPLTHFVIFIFPFLKNSPQFTVEERLENFRHFMK